MKIFKKREKTEQVMIEELQFEINCLKKEISQNRQEIQEIKQETCHVKLNNNKNMINQNTKIHYKKWYSLVTLKIQDFKITLKALMDLGANQNCNQQGLILTKYFEKAKTLSTTIENNTQAQ